MISLRPVVLLVATTCAPGTNAEPPREAGTDTGSVATDAATADVAEVSDATEPTDGSPDATSPYPKLFPASRFDTPLTSNPTLDPSSASLVQAFVKQYQDNYGSVGVHNGTAGQPIYTISNTQPNVPVAVTGGCNSFTSDTGTQIPFPPYAYTTGTGDSPIALYQPLTDTVWEFWQASTSNGGASWTACWGGKIQPVSTSLGVFPSPYGVAASGISYVATTITFADVQAQVIGHTLGVDIVVCNGSVQPADRTDCGSNAGQPSEGSWFFMPKTVPMPSGLSPFAQMVFIALQDYGMVVMDQAGAVMLAAENGNDWTTTGHTGTDPVTASFAGAQEYSVVATLPWSSMQVLAPAAP